jgi:signal transduction histidine kinase
MKRGRGDRHTDALIRPAHVGLAQVAANGTLTGLDAEFARLLGVEIADVLHRPIADLPPPVNDCWRQVAQTAPDRSGVRRWSIVVGRPPDRRSLDVMGWTSINGHGSPVVQLLASEAPPAQQAESLSNVVERARLAREIHDGLAQDLWLAKMTVAKLARHPTLDEEGRALCDELVRSIDSGLAEARTAVLSMRSPTDGVLTLSELVARQVEEFSDRFGIRVDAHIEEGHVVPARVAIEILRILQEALNNVRKHATARRIIIRLHYRRGSVVLSVRDNGLGFDPATVRSGFGRQSMQERALSIGAKLKFASSPGRGTTVTLRVPASQLVEQR